MLFLKIKFANNYLIIVLSSGEVLDLQAPMQQ